jgi:hypothetical protein
LKFRVLWYKILKHNYNDYKTIIHHSIGLENFWLALANDIGRAHDAGSAGLVLTMLVWLVWCSRCWFDSVLTMLVRCP